MNREESINLIKTACLKANPRLEGRNTSVQIPAPFSGIINFRDEKIRLSDVLLAISKDWHKEDGKWVFFDNQMQLILQTCALWNLKDDNLLNQSDETLEFLAKLFT